MADYKSWSTVLDRVNGVPTVLVNGSAIHIGAVGVRLPPFGKPSLKRPDTDFVWHYDETALVGLDPLKEVNRISVIFERLFDECPKALGACHLWLAPSKKWARKYPDDLATYDRPLDLDAAYDIPPAIGSKQWLNDSVEVSKVISGALHQRFNGRIILYQFGTGACAENQTVIDPHRNGSLFFGDFNPQTVGAFQRYLHQRYQGSLSALRSAWGSAGIDFSNVGIPDRFERLAPGQFSLGTSAKEHVADYYRFCSAALDQWVVSVAKAIKQATNDSALTASPIGSILDAGIN